MNRLKFDELKNKLQLENFSGEKPLTIEQDFYASVLIGNLAALIRNNAEEELKERNKDKELKHDYVINNNILIGKLKFNLILVLLEENAEKQMKMLFQLKRADILKEKNLFRLIDTRKTGSELYDS